MTSKVVNIEKQLEKKENHFLIFKFYLKREVPSVVELKLFKIPIWGRSLNDLINNIEN